jgi:hypothetical protein
MTCSKSIYRRLVSLPVIAAIGGLVIALAPPTAISAAQDSLTTSQMINLPPAAANKTVRKDLLSLFQPVQRISPGMRVRLQGVQFLTHPYGTEFKGLCRRDELDLNYAPTDQAAKPAVQPLRPYGIDAAPAFHVTRLPSRGVARGDGSELVWNKACKQLEGDDDALWFGADTAFHAAQGANFLQVAVDRVKAGTLKAGACSGRLNSEKTTCDQVIVEVGDLAKIDQITVCPSTPELACYAIDLDGSTRLTIIGRVAEEELVPTAIVSIAVERYIVAT